jgi:hypothetical protein
MVCCLWDTAPVCRPPALSPGFLLLSGEPPLRYNGATIPEARVARRGARVRSTHALQGETAMPFYDKGGH